MRKMINSWIQYRGDDWFWHPPAVWLQLVVQKWQLQLHLEGSRERKRLCPPPQTTWRCLVHWHPMTRSWSLGVKRGGECLFIHLVGCPTWKVEGVNDRRGIEGTVRGHHGGHGEALRGQKWDWRTYRGLGPRLPRHWVNPKAQHGCLCIRAKSDLEWKWRIRWISIFVFSGEPRLLREVQMFLTWQESFNARQASN